MTPRLLSLDMLDSLVADQFLFALEPEAEPANDDDREAPPEEVSGGGEASGAEPNDAAPPPLAPEANAFVFEPLVDGADAWPVGADVAGNVSHSAPDRPWFFDGAGVPTSEPLPAEASVPQIVPELNVPPLIPETPAPTGDPLGPDHVGYVAPERSPPAPTFSDLAGFVPPEPPPEEPQFLDVLPGFEEADASGGLMLF